MPAGIEECITVAAVGENDVRPEWTNWGSVIDIIAPGVNINSTFLYNGFKSLSGTSMACPFVAASSALILSKNPNYSCEDVCELLKENGRRCKDSYYDSHIYDRNALYIGNMTVYQQQRTDLPHFSVESGKYVDGITLEITCSDTDADIYYTIDGTRASLANAILYTGPFTITTNTQVHAFAIVEGKLKSLQSYSEYFIIKEDPDGNFEIDSDGIITAYTGTNDFLIIPETIAGITVTGIGDGVFMRSPVAYSIQIIHLPDTLTYIGNYAFYECLNMTYCECNNLKEVGNFAFANCQSVDGINLSYLEKVGEYAFFLCYSLTGDLINDKLTTINRYSFYEMLNIFNIDLPNVTRVEYAGLAYMYRAETISVPNLEYLACRGFAYCASVTEMSFPHLTEIDSEGYQFAYDSSLKKLNIPNLEGVIPNRFVYDSSLQTLVLRKVSVLSEYSLENAHSLECLYIPNVTEIKVSALLNNYSMKMLFAPKATKVLSLPPSVYNPVIYLTEKTTTIYDDPVFNYTILAPENSYAQQFASDKSNYTFINSYFKCTALGATIRLIDNGLRFGFSWKGMDELKPYAETIQYGIEYDKGEKNNSLTYLKIAHNYTYHEDTDTTTFNLVVKNIPYNELDTVLSVRGYVNIDGMIFKSPVIQHSFNSVAVNVMADSAIDQATKQELVVIINGGEVQNEE